MNETAKYYREYRCTGCDKLMFKGVLIDSEVEVKCKRCGEVNKYVGKTESEYACLHAATCPHRVTVGDN